MKACDENPRYASEEFDRYVSRIDALSGKIASDAADRGTAIHKVLEDYPSPCRTPSLAPWWDCFDVWYKENIDHTIHNEVRLADHDIGVAGTCDLVAVHKAHGLCLCDYKTKRKMGGDIFYPSYANQLAFYAHAYAKREGLAAIPTCISIAIDSAEPNPPLEKVWTPEEIEEAHLEFLCMAWLFFAEKDFWPVGRWAPEFSSKTGAFA